MKPDDPAHTKFLKPHVWFSRVELMNATMLCFSWCLVSWDQYILYHGSCIAPIFRCIPTNLSISSLVVFTELSIFPRPYRFVWSTIKSFSLSVQKILKYWIGIDSSVASSFLISTSQSQLEYHVFSNNMHAFCCEVGLVPAHYYYPLHQQIVSQKNASSSTCDIGFFVIIIIIRSLILANIRFIFIQNKIQCCLYVNLL